MREKLPGNYDSASLDAKKPVEQIIAADQANFESWVSDPKNQRNLNLPKAAARYLLVPGRILELSDNPASIDVLILEQNSENIRALIMEHRSETVTDEKVWQHYLQTTKKYQLQEPNLPDPYHKRFLGLVENGQISLKDYITNHIKISICNVNTECLYIQNYMDRQELRGSGVATSFYLRLHENAIKMGFRFITGFNNSKNVKFFTGKLGRHTLREIKPELRETLWESPVGTALDMYTIDLLSPKDEQTFLINPRF